MAEYRKSERRLGDEDVARHRHEALTGGIGSALVIARHDDPLTLMLHDDLRRAEHVARGHESDVDFADTDRLVISDRLARLRPVARRHDRQRLRRCEHRAMPTARMVGMAV